MNQAKELFHNISTKRKVYFDPLLSEVDLALIDVEILAYIDEFPENNTFTEILNSKEYSKSHISTAIKRLISRGYLTREKSENNKKIYHLKLQQNSNYIINEYKKYVQKFQEDALKDISQQEIEILTNLLKKINNNLQNN